MDDTFEDLDFLVGWCPTCDREVLAHRDPELSTGESVCVYCDGRSLQELRSVSGGDLAELGYAPWSEDGCAGSTGCGSGRCGRR